MPASTSPRRASGSTARGRPRRPRFHEHGRELLLKEGWTGVCRLIGEELTSEDTPKRRKALDRLLSYFLAHMSRIDYAGRLAAGEAIGSGVVEGAAKTLGLRLKARGPAGDTRTPARWPPWSAAARPTSGTFLEAGGVNPKNPRVHPTQPAPKICLLKTLPVRPQFRYNLPRRRAEKAAKRRNPRAFNAFPTQPKLKPKWRNWQTH